MEWFFIHPAENALKLICNLREIVLAHNHVTAANINLIAEGKDHRIAGNRLFQFPFIGDNGFDFA